MRVGVIVKNAFPASRKGVFFVASVMLNGAAAGNRVKTLRNRIQNERSVNAGATFVQRQCYD